MDFSISLLQAKHGDSIFISAPSSNSNFNILIDGGPTSVFHSNKRPHAGPLKNLLDDLKKKKEIVNLLIVTHVDDDHIGGILAICSNEYYFPSAFDKVWFNTSSNIQMGFKKGLIEENEIIIDDHSNLKTSINQGIRLESKLIQSGWVRSLIYDDREIRTEGGVSIDVLSPDRPSLSKLMHVWKRSEGNLKTSHVQNDYHIPINEFNIDENIDEDNSIFNCSSIALLLERNNKKILLLADSKPSTIVDALRKRGFSSENKIKLDLVKISHHGSLKNTSAELLSIICCDVFLISTDGTKHAHPNKSLIARLLRKFPNSKIYLNYNYLIERLLLPEDGEYRSRLLPMPNRMEI